MWWTWESLIRIFTPSSFVVSPPGAMGSSILQSLTLRFTTATSAMNQSIGLTYSSAVT